MNKEEIQNKMRGCLIGGAAGDALGFAIEFMREPGIFRVFGSNGITEYYLPAIQNSKALISDDTQMTLFTATGLLVGATQAALQGITAKPRSYVENAYLDWLQTQRISFDEAQQLVDRKEYSPQSWLMNLPELFSPRAPGSTCLSALEQCKQKRFPDDRIAHPMNYSKGCGGIMRVAPVGLFFLSTPIETVDMEAAQIAAITHGHPLGYMPAAVLAHIIHRIILSSEEISLKEIILDARDTVCGLFKNLAYVDVLRDTIDVAVDLAESNLSDLDCIHRIGEGWVAEETMGIAIFCALRYQNDFSKALITSVNHNGDSDSTGAVTGNILGAWLGYEAIDEKWKTNLELKDTILEIADDLSVAAHDDLSAFADNEMWLCKYASNTQ